MKLPSQSQFYFVFFRFWLRWNVGVELLRHLRPVERQPACVVHLFFVFVWASPTFKFRSKFRSQLHSRFNFISSEGLGGKVSHCEIGETPLRDGKGACLCRTPFNLELYCNSRRNHHYSQYLSRFVWGFGLGGMSSWNWWDTSAWWNGSLPVSYTFFFFNLELNCNF